MKRRIVIQVKHLVSQQRLPTRLEDYVLGKDNDSSNEQIINFALFSYCELVTFKEALNNQH